MGGHQIGAFYSMDYMYFVDCFNNTYILKLVFGDFTCRVIAEELQVSS